MILQASKFELSRFNHDASSWQVQNQYLHDEIHNRFDNSDVETVYATSSTGAATKLRSMRTKPYQLTVACWNVQENNSSRASVAHACCSS